MDDNWYFRMVDSAADAREYLTQHPRVSVQVASFMAVRWVPDLCVPVPVPLHPLPVFLARHADLMSALHAGPCCSKFYFLVVAIAVPDGSCCA